MTRQPSSYRALASYLKRGGLIAYPTEACFGLGCDPLNHRAVKRLLQLKQRPQHKGLILIASEYAQVARYLQPIGSEQLQLLKAAGEQVTTYLMPARPSTPHHLRGGHDTLAVRLTKHPYAAAICHGVGNALVSTSANHGGKRPVKTAATCKRLFGSKVRVLTGMVGKNKNPSTIRVWTDDRIVRK